MRESYDQSLPYTIVFFKNRRTTESTWSACPSILLYFKEKNEGKLWSVSPLHLLFFQKQKNDVKHMISLSFHTIIFQRKEWGKAMISLSLILLFFQKQKKEGKHMISLSFHTIIFQWKEWGKAMISLSLTPLFFQKPKKDVKHMISLSFHTIIFQRKEWGKAMISLSLILLFFSKTEEGGKAHDQPVLPYYYISKKRMRETIWSVSPLYFCFFQKQKNDGKHMISLTFHTIIFQRKEWGRTYDQSLLYNIVLFFFITERRTTESTWSACPSILLFFKEKNEGKLWSVSPLYYCFFFFKNRRTTESTWSACPSILLYFKEKNEGKLWSVSPLYYCFFFYNKRRTTESTERRKARVFSISLSFHTIIFQRKEWGKAMISLSLILLWLFSL